jgi:arabinofuranosyltransferase
MAERRDAAPWVLLGIAGIVLVVHSLAYNFVTDDAYISFVFSRNFAEHGELVFNLGEQVEGYTNFLWTVVLGLLMMVGVEPEISSRVLGTVCALVTLYLVFRTMQRAVGKQSPLAAVPSLLLACSSGFACWTSGGLETQLFTMLVAGALDAVVASHDEPRAIRRAGVFLALAAMTRPEGLLVAAVLGLVHLGNWALRPQRSIRDELFAAAWFLGIWAPWFAWRYYYYGHLFPNTYYVKASGEWANPKLASEMLDNGIYYVWVWVKQTRLLYALPLLVIGLVAKPRTPRFVLGIACGVLAVVYLAYTITVGGDFMGLHRFIMPVFVFAAILVGLGVEMIDARAKQPIFTIVAGVVLVGLFAFTQYKLTRDSVRWGNFGNDRGIDTPAFLMVYTEDRAKIGRAMQACFRESDFSIVGGAGAQPYEGRMRGIDVFGLVSDRIAHEEPRIRARAGHTKWGSDALLAQFDPTFVFSCYRLHRSAAQPQLPCAGFWLNRGFEHVTMHIPGLREQGEYYTFLANKARNFQCPGRVR